MASCFNIEKVIQCFHQSLNKLQPMDEHDIYLEDYLLAYEEINKCVCIPIDKI